MTMERSHVFLFSEFSAVERRVGGDRDKVRGLLGKGGDSDTAVIITLDET